MIAFFAQKIQIHHWIFEHILRFSNSVNRDLLKHFGEDF